jgi:type I restriction enzyme R subunit
MADGATLPIRVEVPKQDLQLSTVQLDEAFDELAEQEGLTDEEKERLARKASKVKPLLRSEKRVEAVCADIVEHYYAKVHPLGLKAQVVAFDREMCVAYHDAITKLIAGRTTRGGKTPEATVVMTAGSKDDPDDFKPFVRDRQQEAAVKGRFRDSNDPLEFLIVTAKLLTGFDAPIDGVMYLDKPLRKHTLFQALTRTNRRWTNPETDQEKTHGLIVDYIGLAKQIAEAMRVPRKEGEREPLDTETLADELVETLAAVLTTFDGIDRSDAGFAAMMEAQQRIQPGNKRDDFARGFLKVHALWELLWPDEKLVEHRSDYRWLAKVYASVQPSDSPDALLWLRLGAKTLALINEHVISVQVRVGVTDHITIDEETLQALREMGFEPEPEPGPGGTEPEPPSPDEIIESIEQRIAKRLSADLGNPKYKSLAERLDQLRQMQLVEAADSVEFLKKLLEVAKDVVAADQDAAEKAEEGGDGQPAQTSLLPEERIGALTQIFNEYKPDVTPDIIENVVHEIDAVVSAARFTNWQTSREGTRLVKTEIRRALKKFGLPAANGLFDRAYDYVAEHY